MLTSSWNTGFTVSDLERSVAFYRDILGMEEVRRAEVSGDGIARMVGVPGARLKICTLRLSDGHILELIEYADKGEQAAAGLPANSRGVAHLAFYCDDVPRAYEELRAKGVQFVAPPQAVVPGRPPACYFRDPDGIFLELNQRPTAAGQAPGGAARGA
jgi:catechol 2,3-dioxygenase-like lactoylglutathione lyase family enzyme